MTSDNGPLQTAQVLSERYGPSYRWLVTITGMVGVVSMVLAMTTVNVAVPDVMGAFGIGQDQAQWMSSAYMATMTAGMLINAWLTGVLGERRTFVGALAFFSVGALLGGILGSNIAGRGDRTEGAVLGAVVGGGLGAAVGNANDRYRCDSRGPYFAYNDTVPYRESRSWRYGANDSTYYTRQRCRLAPAPVDSNGHDYRYVRVCPDANGRYRITG